MKLPTREEMLAAVLPIEERSIGGVLYRFEDRKQADEFDGRRYEAWLAGGSKRT